MKVSNSLFKLILFLLISISPTLALAALTGGGGSLPFVNMITVETNGNDSTCTRNSAAIPCLTPAKALSLAQSGDIVKLGSGSFNLGTTTAASITSAGTGYTVGDILTFSDASITSAPTFTVSTVNGSGGVTGVTLLNSGYGNFANAGSTISPTGGTGTGVAGRLTAVNAVVPNGVYLKGSGIDITILQNGSRDQRGTYVSCGSNCRVSDLTIQTPATTNIYSFPIGVGTVNGSTALGTGNVVWNIHTKGWSDGTYFQNNGETTTTEWTFLNSIFEANFDTENVFENTPDSGVWALTQNYYNCIFKATGLANDTNAAFIRGIAITDTGGTTINLYGGSVTVATASGNTSAFRACFSNQTTTPHGGSNGGIINVYGTKCITPGTANSYAFETDGSTPAAVMNAGPGTSYNVKQVHVNALDQFLSTSIADSNGIDRFNQTNAIKKPALTSCGTSPSIVGSDNSFTITVGSTATGCIATFGGTYTIAPVCNISNRSLSIVNGLTYSVSTTAITLSQTALGGNVVDVNCAFGY